jgi:hypothetical protein
MLLAPVVFTVLRSSGPNNSHGSAKQPTSVGNLSGEADQANDAGLTEARAFRQNQLCCLKRAPLIRVQTHVFPSPRPGL